MTVKPKRNCYVGVSDNDGIGITITLTTEQKWKARKAGKYYLMSKKGAGVTLRLTYRHYVEFFTEVEE